MIYGNLKKKMKKSIKFLNIGGGGLKIFLKVFDISRGKTSRPTSESSSKELN